jgi:hypothetical protein
LKIADQLLLLTVDRDDRLTILQRLAAGCVDPPELQITIGMLTALPSLHVRLQAVTRGAQQLCDRHVLDLMTKPAQPTSEMPHALRGPQQRRLRITTTILVDQPLEIDQHLRIDLDQRPAPTARPADPPRPDRLARPQLTDPLTNRVDRDPRRARGCRDPTTPRRPRLRRRPQPPLTLVQLTRQRTKLRADRNLVNHTPRFDPAITRPADLFMNRP